MKKLEHSEAWHMSFFSVVYIHGYKCRNCDTSDTSGGFLLG